MRQRKGFTLIELLVVISIIALLIGILLPALGAARQTARMMQSNTHLRGIHQGMVIFAQANKTGTNDGQYPGFNPSGGVLTAEDVADRVSEIDHDFDDQGYHGGTVSARFALLLDQNLFSPDYAINPLETNADVVAYDPNEQAVFDEDENDNVDSTVDTTNYSYAMLAITDDVTSGTDENADGGGRVSGARAIEWSETLNTNAAVIGDRVLGATPVGDHYSHVTREDSGQWRGGIGWNDNHVGTENTTHHDTRYAFEESDEDNVFVSTTEDGDDACLTHPRGEDDCNL